MAFSSLRIMMAEGGGALQKGYWGGGLLGGVFIPTDDIQLLNFDTEASSLLSADIGLARYSAEGVSSPTRGYFGGGQVSSSGNRNDIDGIIFETEAAISPSAVVATSRYGKSALIASVEGIGYWGGGGNSFSNINNQIDGIIFSTEAATNPSITIGLARKYSTGAFSLTNGYFCGGKEQDNQGLTQITGMKFSDVTATNPSTTLSAGHVAGANLNTKLKGYIVGGAVGYQFGDWTHYNKYDAIIFATDTMDNNIAVLSRVKRFVSGVSGKSKGYTGSGNLNSFGYYSDIDGFIFGSETAENPSATLPTGVMSTMGGVQAWPQ